MKKAFFFSLKKYLFKFIKWKFCRTYCDLIDKDFGRFYCNFKVHKEHTPMSAPPPRPIVSVSGSFSENIGVFVEYHKRAFRYTRLSEVFGFRNKSEIRIVSKLNPGGCWCVCPVHKYTWRGKPGVSVWSFGGENSPWNTWRISCKADGGNIGK